MIKNIVFDIGHVLIGFEWMEHIRARFDEETARIVTDAIWKKGYWSELDRGVLSDEEILELFYSEAPDHRQEIKEAFDNVGECLLRCDYAIPWIDELKSRGFNVYYLSNYSKKAYDECAESLAFMPYMDGGLVSFKAGRTKPLKSIG